MRRASRYSITELNLSWYQGLQSRGISLSAVYFRQMGQTLRKLFLRGCKALTDTGVQTVLRALPNLQVLDVLDDPKLTNHAFQDAPRGLRVVATGALGKPHVAAAGKLTSFSRPQTASAFTANVFLPSLLGGVQLTHLVMPNCREFKVLPSMPSTLQHLDLRGSNIDVPDQALETWKPLSQCAHLSALVLADTPLSPAAVLACIKSLPSSATLRALDVSSTAVDLQFFHALPLATPALTHLRAAACPKVHNLVMLIAFHSLKALEVLDVARCGMLAQPLTAVQLNGALDITDICAKNLRLLGVGNTDLAQDLLLTRRTLLGLAPQAEVRNSSLDILRGYAALPPDWI